MDINNIYNQIKNKFDNNDCQFIKINNKLYKELFNYKYMTEIFKDNRLRNEKIIPDSIHDKKERQKILQEVDKNFNYFLDDLYTRQFVIQLKYNDDKNLASCLSLLQFIMRNNILNTFVFVRSQNFGKNFLYDNQTYIFINDLLIKKLQENNIIKNSKYLFSKVEVHITSLHQEL